MLQNVSSKTSQILKNGLFSDCWGALLSPRGTFQILPECWNFLACRMSRWPVSCGCGCFEPSSLKNRFSSNCSAAVQNYNLRTSHVRSAYADFAECVLEPFYGCAYYTPPEPNLPG